MAFLGLAVERAGVRAYERAKASGDRAARVASMVAGQVGEQAIAGRHLLRLPRRARRAFAVYASHRTEYAGERPRVRGSDYDLSLTFLDDPISLTGGIGLFDSGVGGLTVLGPLARFQPRWPLVMIADQAHVPYGGRPLDEIRGFALAQTEFLFELGVERVVMACNISSATALGEARRRFGERRVFGMVEPGCALALRATRSGRIGVLATQGTVRSGAYAERLRDAVPSVDCLSLACPEFVPLIEAGHVDDDAARDAVAPYVAQLRAFGADVAILGCTHYPHLRTVLQAAAPEIHFVDPADGILDSVRTGGWVADQPVAPVLLTTGAPDLLAAQVARLYAGPQPPRVGRVIWRSGDSSVDGDPSRAVG